MNNKRNTTLKVRAGCRISLYSGELEWSHPERMSTLHFYHAFSGDKLQLSDDNYQFAVATYIPVFDDKYMYTYIYQKEENWTTYQNDLHPDSYQQNEYLFSEELYFRVNLKRIDGKEITADEAEHVSENLNWVVEEEAKTGIKPYFKEEIVKTEADVKSVQKEDALSLLILTDSHYTINGTWEDTKNNIQSLSSKVNYEGIIHLGDCTDGMVSREVTVDYVHNIQRDIRNSGKPLYYVMGNHDSNYFKNNLDKFTKAEMIDLYLGMQPQNVFRESNQTYYYADFEKQQIRCFFLDSFDYRENVRYGFSDDELKWLEFTLNQTPNEWSILLFSHVPPIPRLHYWSDEIRGSEMLMKILKTYQNSEKGKILAFIHGHNHADQIDRSEGFPIISIGCAKCEYFTDKKPEGSIIYERKLGMLSQELWDILIISKNKKSLDFIRFGAGENRHIELE